MKVFITVEIEEGDDIKNTDDVIEYCIRVDKRLKRGYKVHSQLKFTNIPRRYERTEYRPASDV